MAVSKQLDQAAAYFSNSMRVPAALIAGQAGNMLFRLTELGTAQRSPTSAPPGPTSFRSRVYIALWRTHFLLISYTVCSQLTAVLLCSTAHAQILDIGRDELALEPTALDLIIRHVEFEYVTVRIAFFSGMVTFLLGIAARAVASLGAAPKRSTVTGKREFLLSAALGTMLAATLAWWMHIYNEDLTNFTGMWHLLRRFALLARTRWHGSPLTAFSALSFLASIGFAAASLCAPDQAGQNCS